MSVRRYLPMKIRLFIAFILVGFLFLSGCTKRLETVTAPMDRVELNLPMPKPVVLEDIDYSIVEIEGKAFIAMSMKDYRKLADNMEQLQNFILEQKDLLREYQNYYERSRPKDSIGTGTTGFEADKNSD